MKTEEDNEMVRTRIFEKEILAACGHKTRDSLLAKALGEDPRIKDILLNEKGRIRYCHKCLEKMAIRCAWCGETILIGEPITLYSPAFGSEMPDFAVEEDARTLPRNFIGCFRDRCVVPGETMDGILIPPGKARRIEKPFDPKKRLKEEEECEIVILNDFIE